MLNKYDGSSEDSSSNDDSARISCVSYRRILKNPKKLGQFFSWAFLEFPPLPF